MALSVFCTAQAERDDSTSNYSSAYSYSTFPSAEKLERFSSSQSYCLPLAKKFVERVSVVYCPSEFFLENKEANESFCL